MISAVKLKKCITNTSIFDIIVNKLYYKKKLYQIILFDIDKDLKISFYYTILFLSLTIYLKIESD